MTIERDFVVAIHRKSTMLLDNIGIRIKVEDLASWPIYHALRRQYYGTHWLSRLWCQCARKHLAPGTHRLIERAFDLSLALLQRQLLEAVLAKGEELLGGEDD